jgi:hypothetical protein
MSLKGSLFALYARWRTAQIRKLVAEPEKAQRALLDSLIRKASNTAFGRDHGFSKIPLGTPEAYEAYKKAVPVRDYEALRPWVDRTVAGEADILWPGKPSYLAKTSGTTSGTKYIPLTKDSMPCQVRGARDAFCFYIQRTGDTAFLDGKMIFLSGSPELEINAGGIKTGRLSGIAQHYVPSWLLRNRLPSWETNCIDDWETKLERITEETVKADMRLISGIPPWVQMFFEKVKAKTGKLPAEVWPNLRLYIEGGVDYAPYDALLTEAMGRKLSLVETFPASEGFIAVQDRGFGEGLLLMLDYGLFYEFIPLETYGTPEQKRIPLWEVEERVAYALILSSNAGLWAYDLGDTVIFNSTKPYRLKVAGRVKHFLSAFGEHVIENEVNSAMLAAVEATGARVTDYTVAPLIGEPSCHEWFVEFATPPADMSQFVQVLDDTLRQKNVYYNDLRAGSLLAVAKVQPLQSNAVREYMKSIGKLGGQNKFPRLTNNRKIAEGLTTFFLTS